MRSFFLGLALLLLARQSYGQSPVINVVTPSAVAPGATNIIIFNGDNLSGVTELWTSFSAQAQHDSPSAPGEKEANGIRYRLSLAKDVPLGIGAVRLAATNGISNLQLLMIDNLPTIAESATNKSVQAAQELELPVAVDGTSEELSFDYYQIAVTNRQNISIEVVAHRLGSLLDPVLRLLDAKGRELGYCDDAPGTGADARLRHTFSAAGQYVIEVRDVRYQGGARYPYRLRVGDFPLAKLPCLPIAPADLKSSSDGAARVIAEQEPNDSSTNATKLFLPASVSGRLDRPKDRDVYEFEVAKDQRIAIVSKTRSIASPCDLFMQILRPDNSLLAEANVTGANDAGITNTFSEAGTFRLLVEELNYGGGPEMGYELELMPYRPGFALSVETDKVEAPAGGTFEIKVSCARRNYDGPIMLTVASSETGFELKQPLVHAKTNETQMKVAVPINLRPGQLVHFGISGYAKIGDGFFETQASTMPALRKLFPQMLYPPRELEGVIALGVKPAQKPAESPPATTGSN